MAAAVGVIQILGMPAALMVADVMAKSGYIEVVRLDHTDAGLISVVVRGLTADVMAAVHSGVTAIQQQAPERFAGHHLIPCPDGNVEAVLALLRSPQSGNSGAAEWLD